MQIKTYNSIELNDLILSEQFKAMPVLPISSHRAISHIRNPRNRADDVLMIIAYELGVMVGYLGVLADDIFNEHGESFHSGWLSCMWVDPQVRGKGIAKQLIAKAFESWNDQILVTEFTPEAKGLYDRTGMFADLRINNGLRCYLRFNLHHVLPKKNEGYKRHTKLLQAIDTIANIPINLKHSILPPLSYKGPIFEQIKRVNEAEVAFIQSHTGGNIERRNAVELNWMMEYPWLVQSPPTAESLRYHFSSVANTFRTVFVKMMQDGVMVGFLYLTIRDGHLKVPYAFFDQQYSRDVMSYLYEVMFTQQLDMLTIFHPDLVDHLSQNSSPFIYKRTIKRHYIITHKLNEHFSDKAHLTIQDGDADCAFT